MSSAASSTASVRVAATIAALAVPYAMWNGALFIPLIEDTDTIEPGSPAARISAATAWLMKNIVSRLAVNNSAPVRARHPGGGHPGRRRRTARNVHQAVERAVGARAASSTVAMPSSVDGVGGHRDHRQPPLGQRCDVGVEIVLGPTRPRSPSRRPRPPAGSPWCRSRHHRRRRPRTMRPSRLRRSVMTRFSASGLPVQLSVQHMSLCSTENTIPQRLCTRQGSTWPQAALLSGLVDGLIASST